MMPKKWLNSLMMVKLTKKRNKKKFKKSLKEAENERAKSSNFYLTKPCFAFCSKMFSVFRRKAFCSVFEMLCTNNVLYGKTYDNLLLRNLNNYTKYCVDFISFTILGFFCYVEGGWH